jgi:hypothetical protein
MALAGHSEWMIQLFGRWGSSAVLGYVREALLGRRGGVIAKVTEGTEVTVEDLKARVVNSMGKEKCGTGGKARAYADLAVEELAQKTLPRLGRLESEGQSLASMLKGLDEQITKMQQDLDIAFGAETPKFVRCMSGLQLKHIVLTRSQAHCGWRWGDSRHTIIREQPPADPEGRAEWCSRCLRRASE